MRTALLVLAVWSVASVVLGSAVGRLLRRRAEEERRAEEVRSTVVQHLREWVGRAS